MAIDYLPIQASSVPCERFFSSSAETDTKCRNRIAPELFEALQMLKFLLKRERLNFTEGLLPTVEQLEQDSSACQDSENVEKLQSLLCEKGIDAFLEVVCVGQDV